MKDLFVDLDGVLCDLKARMAAHGIDVTGGLQVTHGRNALRDKLLTFSFEESVEFFTNMEWVPGSQMLWDAIKHHQPRILSSLPLTESLREPVVVGKLAWCRRHLNLEQDRIILVADGDKTQYVNSNAILIDDMPYNIDPWVAAGGVGILYESVETTISLVELLTTEPLIHKDGAL